MIVNLLIAALFAFFVFTWLNAKAYQVKDERANVLKPANQISDEKREKHLAFVKRVSINGDGTKRDHEKRTKKLLAEAIFEFCGYNKEV